VGAPGSERVQMARQRGVPVVVVWPFETRWGKSELWGRGSRDFVTEIKTHRVPYQVAVTGEVVPVLHNNIWRGIRRRPEDRNAMTQCILSACDSTDYAIFADDLDKASP
jgi:hypothetical protein